MTSRHRFSLTFAILASLASLLLLTWLLLSIISSKTAEQDLISAKISTATDLARLTASALSGDSDAASVERRLTALARSADFKGILVVNGAMEERYRLADSRGADEALGESARKGVSRTMRLAGGGEIVAYAPVTLIGEAPGALRLTLSLSGEHARLAKSRTLFFGYFLLDFILLLGLGGYLLRRVVVIPLDRLLKATERVIAGDYSNPVHIYGSLEVAGLADSFNQMQQSLNARREEVESHLKALEGANSSLVEARLETIRSEKMASVGLLAAGMAHEIGAPLAGIIGYSGILAEELEGDEEKSDYLRRIAEDAARIDRLVRDLLNYARPVKPEIERVDVKELLEDLIDMLERQGQFKQIEASLVTDSELPALFIDRHQLMQVMMNLFINARDAMPNGGMLHISATEGLDETVIISVKDSGEGIPSENMESVFEPFFTTKDPGKGTGLGLAISARLVDSFGGRIVVASEQGGGALFVVTLPGIKV